MPFVTFTVRRGLSAADKAGLSEAMLEAQVTAGYHRADRFHRFLEVDRDDLLVDPRFPDYATDRTDRFMVVEVILSGGRPAGTAATLADEAVRLFGERLHLAPQDILFAFHEVDPTFRAFLMAPWCRSVPSADSPMSALPPVAVHRVWPSSIIGVAANSQKHAPTMSLRMKLNLAIEEYFTPWAAPVAHHNPDNDC
jgi:hypothetical protein